MLDERRDGMREDEEPNYFGEIANKVILGAIAVIVILAIIF